MAEKPEPVKVLYCGVCGLPAEYCEFGPDFEKCKPWLIQKAPELFPDLVKEATSEEADKVSDQLQGTSISAGHDTTRHGYGGGILAGSYGRSILQRRKEAKQKQQTLTRMVFRIKFPRKKVSKRKKIISILAISFPVFSRL